LIGLFLFNGEERLGCRDIFSPLRGVGYPFRLTAAPRRSPKGRRREILKVGCVLQHVFPPTWSISI